MSNYSISSGFVLSAGPSSHSPPLAPSAGPTGGWAEALPAPTSSLTTCAVAAAPLFDILPRCLGNDARVCSESKSGVSQLPCFILLPEYSQISSRSARPRFRSGYIHQDSHVTNRVASRPLCWTWRRRGGRESRRGRVNVSSLYREGEMEETNDGLDINSALLIHTNAQLRTIVGAAVVRV